MELTAQQIDEIMELDGMYEMGLHTRYAIARKGYATIFDMANDVNHILETDAYNCSHQFLKENTDHEVSHVYARERDEVFTYLVSHIVADSLHVQITGEWIEQAERLCNKAHIPFPKQLFIRVVTEFNGYVPLRVQGLPDGTMIPKGTPFLQIRSTAKGFGEMVTWYEARLLGAHYPMGLMTEVHQFYRYNREMFKQEQAKYPELTWDFFKYRLHSFAYRSFNSKHDSLFGGSAWGMLMNGTDDLQTLQLLPFTELGSIAATAHKTMQQFNDELAGFKRAISFIGKLADININLGRIVALVIDTYKPYRVIREYLPILAKFANEYNMHIVLRPDSGDVINQAIEIYKVAQEIGATNVSVIIGEGMSLVQAKKYDKILLDNGVPLAFVFYGVGGGIHKHINRDFTGLAMKTAFSNGENRCKFSADPIKASIAGAVGLYYNENMEIVVDLEENVDDFENLYVDLYYYDKEMADAGEEPDVLVYSLLANYNQVQREVDYAENRGTQKGIIKSETVLKEVQRIAELHGLVD